MLFNVFYIFLNDNVMEIDKYKYAIFKHFILKVNALGIVSANNNLQTNEGNYFSIYGNTFSKNIQIKRQKQQPVSSDGSKVISYSNDKTIRMWDVSLEGLMKLLITKIFCKRLINVYKTKSLLTCYKYSLLNYQIK
ncbi:hypothetical protein RFI_28268 [Reticulomyxa filosa]|uniref:Uncharacterized protein n=1 Tax=Reticulomyxa filosa TaxID=46433 RepID=X6M5C8_RETFI|nr:hypothetical protein RFI_28268 [Reticulomyxa filosa]|eukprot:ETO09119.1 hypothetical protein RFI_28268 [Reticulomyxa filosa]